MPKPELISLDELDTLLGPAKQPAATSQWVASVCARADVASLDDRVVADLAAERSQGSARAAVAGVFASLAARHASDRVTLALLAALENYHLPALLDEARGR